MVMFETDFNLHNSLKQLIKEFMETIPTKAMIMYLLNSNYKVIYKHGELKGFDIAFNFGECLATKRFNGVDLSGVLRCKTQTKEVFVHDNRRYVLAVASVLSTDGKLAAIIMCICRETEYSEEIFGAMKIMSKTVIKEVIDIQKRLLNNYEQAIIKTISDGFMAVDKDGIIRFLNDKAFEILGVGPEAIGKNLREITEFEPELFEVLKTGKGWIDKEFIIDMKSKKNIHLLKTAIPVLDESGKVAAVIDTFREIKSVRNLVNKMTGARACFTFDDIIYKSAAMDEVVKFARKIAKSESSVLIQGESGTGKELFAHAIHNSSNRRCGPFITIDCSTIPHDLVESELFGYVEGAFTGARRGGRPGKFELANGGTIFLDEIGEMSPEIQKKFLRVLQNRTVTRIGDHVPIPIDIRVIAATNRNLEEEVKERNFREDLFYRLNVINLHIPPLRERKEDIIPTALYFVSKIGEKTGKADAIIDEGTQKYLMNYSWPGNVRELKNVIERGLNIMEGKCLKPEHLPKRITEHAEENSRVGINLVNQKGEFNDISRLSLEELEKKKIFETLKLYNWNRKKTAEALGIARSTLYEKIKKYRINV